MSAGIDQKENNQEGNNAPLSLSFFRQHRAVQTLIDESRADGDFYVSSLVAAVIATIGLHMGNTVVIIGGMLIAPILFPILAFGMGIVTASKSAVVRSLVIITKTAVGVFFISFLTSFLLNHREVTEQMVQAANPDFPFFFVAFFSGIVASYSWAKKQINQTLPGVAVSVALVPPLSTIGVSLSLLSRDLFAGSLLLFLVNLLGIVFASIIIFSLFGFSRLQTFQDREIEQEKKVQEASEQLPTENKYRLSYYDETDDTPSVQS